MQMNSFTNGGKDIGGSTDDISGQITTTMLGLVAQRTEQLQAAQSIRSSRLQQLQRERKRLEQKLPPDSPRLAQIDQRIDANQTMIASLGDEIYRSKTPISTPVADAWTIFGSVRDARMKGIEGLSILFYSVDGRPMEQLGYTCTLAEGYFKLERREPKIDGKEQAYLRVLDKEGNLLYADPIALLPKIGGVDYRDIILADSICTPPGKRTAVTVDKPEKTVGDTGDWTAVEISPEKAAELKREAEEKAKREKEAAASAGTAETAATPDDMSAAETAFKGYAAPAGTEMPKAFTGENAVRKSADDMELKWTVRGHIYKANGEPAVGVIVTLMDRDLVADDRLGQAETNEKGEYEVIYSTHTFRDSTERQPDLYVRVADRSGKQLYRSKKVLRPNAGQVEFLDVKLNK